MSNRIKRNSTIELSEVKVFRQQPQSRAEQACEIEDGVRWFKIAGFVGFPILALVLVLSNRKTETVVINPAQSPLQAEKPMASEHQKVSVDYHINPIVKNVASNGSK